MSTTAAHRTTTSTSSTRTAGRSRLGAAVRRLRPHGHAAAPKPLPPTNAPDHLTRDEIRDAQVQQFGFHSRLC